MARTGRRPAAWAGMACGLLLGVLGLAGPVQAQTQASLQKALDRFILDEGIPGGVLLVDRKNGAALGKGSGRYTTLSRTDFYIDRDVRMVKEIRLELMR